MGDAAVCEGCRFSGKRAGIRRLGPCGKRRAGDEISGRNPGKGLSRPSRPFRPGDAGFPGGVEKPVGPESHGLIRGESSDGPTFLLHFPVKRGGRFWKKAETPSRKSRVLPASDCPRASASRAVARSFSKLPAINRLVSARALVGAWARRPASFIVSFS